MFWAMNQKKLKLLKLLYTVIWGNCEWQTPFPFSGSLYLSFGIREIIKQKERTV